MFSSTQRSDFYKRLWIFVFWGKNIGKNISKNLSGKCSHKFLDNAKQSAKDALKTTSKNVVQKTAETTGDLIGDKISNKVTKISKNSQQIIQRQLQMSIIRKYLKKDTYLQKKDKKLLSSKINIIV